LEALDFQSKARNPEDLDIKTQLLQNRLFRAAAQKGKAAVTGTLKPCKLPIML